MKMIIQAIPPDFLTVSLLNFSSNSWFYLTPLRSLHKQHTQFITHLNINKTLTTIITVLYLTVSLRLVMGSGGESATVRDGILEEFSGGGGFHWLIMFAFRWSGSQLKCCCLFWVGRKAREFSAAYPKNIQTLKKLVHQTLKQRWLTGFKVSNTCDLSSP